jgi:hypothetical protein
MFVFRPMARGNSLREVETKSSEWAGKASTPELNSYDILVALLIDVQDCGENWSHLTIRHDKPDPLNQRAPLSGGGTLPSGYGESTWLCPVIGRG